MNILFRTFIAIVSLTLSSGAFASHSVESTTDVSHDDPYQWLEDIHGDKPMAWVKTQNAITSKQFIDTPQFTRTRDRILEVFDSEAHIPMVSRRGNYLFNFWIDKDHPRGLWRRTTLEEYGASIRFTSPSSDYATALEIEFPG